MHKDNYFARRAGRGLTGAISFATCRWKPFLLGYVCIATVGCALLYIHNGKFASFLAFLH
jgi:hypothetical protein